jgi:SAM-dependent methyltransferase
MVKNEQDIIEPFIRHNARFVDTMIIVDNASVDETRHIALACARELGNIVLSDSPTFAYTQSEQTTRLLHYCQSAFFADYIVFLDADEFISAPDCQTFNAALATIPSQGVGLMPWRTFVLNPTEEITAQAADPPRTMRCRRADEAPIHRKAILRLDGACRNDLIVWQGAHNVVTTTGERLPATQLDTLSLLHFPVRSREQLTAKTTIGWMAYLAQNPQAAHKKEGSHWRDIFDRHVKSAVPITDEALCDISAQYAQTITASPPALTRDTPPSDYTRRYSTGAVCDPLTLTARSWERSLTEPPLFNITRPDHQTHNEATASATAFEADWHWNNLFVDVPPFQFIAEKHQPDSVLDIGCGIGAYLRLFQHHGASTIFGIDGIPQGGTALAETAYTKADLAQPIELGKTFDLVMCTEVAEHLEMFHADTLISGIVRHARDLIVFSAAEPGQPGHGHIGCAPLFTWLDKFAAQGFYPDAVDSLGMRALATLSWFRRNLVVLRRGEAPDAAATQRLTEIGERRFAWYSQQPGVRNVPFTEPPPPPPYGYATTETTR